MNPKKRIAADILKSGVSRIKVLDEKALEEAITRQDIRNLIRKGAIIKIQKKGTSKAHSRYLLKQKKKGRRRGAGNRRGTYKARTPKKADWMKTIRSIRLMSKSLLKEGRLKKEDYLHVYSMAKGGVFRSKGHTLNYLKDHDLLKAKEKAKKPKQAKPKEGD